MITFITTVLIITIVGVGISYNEIRKLRKRLDVLHNETNNRISVTDQQIHLRINNDLEEIHELIRSIEIDIKSDTKKKLDSLMEQLIKKIPITNDELLKEVKQMRDDFFALRQNF